MLESIHVNTLEDAVLAHEVLCNYHGDNDIRQDKFGEYHLIKPIDSSNDGGC